MNLEEQKIFYENNGYLIFNIKDEFLIDEVNKDIEKILKKEKKNKKKL